VSLPIRPKLSVAAALLAPVALLAFAVVTVPTDIQLPGTQPGEIQALQTPNKCDNCHGGYDLAVEPAHGWRGGMMAQAGRDPIFWATMAVAEQDFPGAGDLCLRCHAAEGWLGGRSTPTDGSGLQAADSHGVSCDLCHRMTDPDASEWLGEQDAPFLAHDGGSPPAGWYGSGMYVLWAGTNEKFGPYDDAQANHAAYGSDFHRKAEMCGTCHDVSNPAVGDLAHNHGAQIPLPPGAFSGVPGAPVDQKAAFHNPPAHYGVVERTFSEHQASAFATLAVSDFPGLPPELQDGAIEAAWQAAVAASPDADYADGTQRLYTCQSCHMPPVTGKGCNKAGVPVRTDLPLHDLTGGNVWMPDVIAYMDGQGQLLLGGGLSTAELDALADGKARALATLRSAAALHVDGDTLRVVNLTGHKLISGYPEGRRMWVRARWYDGQDGLLREDGAYGPLPVQIHGEPAVVQTLLAVDPPDTRVYEAHFAMTQEWAAQLLALGWPPSLALSYDRVTGAPAATLGGLAAQPPGTHRDTFRFALNNLVSSDTRIPPYGFRHDAALERSTLPVPATQYGDPGPGGTYRHWDEIALQPPPGAGRAELELLYQPTSWEYVQFLDLANDGSEAFLASTGSDLLQAWMATDMAPPQVIASAQWTGTGPPDPWTDLGYALAGIHGPPSLTGTGTLQGGAPLSLRLDDAVESSTAVLFAGLSKLYAPFKGGTLVPSLEIMIPGLSTGGGSLVLNGTWPPGLPAGVTVTLQFWILDPVGPVGFAASNALLGTTP
jgi:hypothetical protein